LAASVRFRGTEPAYATDEGVSATEAKSRLIRFPSNARSTRELRAILGLEKAPSCSSRPDERAPAPGARHPRLGDHKYGTAAGVSRVDPDSQLLDETQQRVSARRLRRPTAPHSLCRNLAGHHFFAKGNELVLANSAELHSNVQSGDRYQVGRLRVAVRDEGSPAFLKRCENREQLFF